MDIINKIINMVIGMLLLVLPPVISLYVNNTMYLFLLIPYAIVAIILFNDASKPI